MHAPSSSSSRSPFLFSFCRQNPFLYSSPIINHCRVSLFPTFIFSPFLFSLYFSSGVLKNDEGRKVKKKNQQVIKLKNATTTTSTKGPKVAQQKKDFLLLLTIGKRNFTFPCLVDDVEYGQPVYFYRLASKLSIFTHITRHICA